jgi:YD repeat-containing protein
MVDNSVPKSDFGFDTPMTRRDCVRLVLGGCGLLLSLPRSVAEAAVKTEHQSILDRFLGEELFFHIGYWLIPHCGEAEGGLVKTDFPNIYRASLQGRTVGVIDALVGRLRYSYISYSQLVEKDGRFRPVFSQIIRKRAGRQRHRSITYDYKAGEIIFSKIKSDGKIKVQRAPMKAGRFYEDYLTLGYNMRLGYYGPPERGQVYRLPLYIHKKMKSIELRVASAEEAREQRPGKSIRTDKDYLIKFQVDRKDLSSGSGEVELWVTPEITPIMGTIKDVVFFGDLWGNLIERRALDPNRIFAIPDDIKKHIRLP